MIETIPARRGKALQHRLRGGLFVEMHRLRVELGRKCQYFLAGDATRTESAEMTGWKIFEGERHIGDCQQGSPIVAAICGNLNPPTRMARA